MPRLAERKITKMKKKIYIIYLKEKDYLENEINEGKNIRKWNDCEPWTKKSRYIVYDLKYELDVYCENIRITDDGIFFTAI